MNYRKSFSSIGIICIVLIGVLYVITQRISPAPQINFKPQQLQLFRIETIGNKPIDVRATTVPQFALPLTGDKFKDLWQVDATKRQSLVSSRVTNLKGDIDLALQTQFDSSNKDVILTPQTGNQFKPGLYQLNVKVKTYTGQDIVITQDFTWGVMAINTGKAMYQSGDTVKIGMGVLDNLGNTKCIAVGNITFDTAKVWLTISSPSGKVQKLSTNDQTIVGSKECAPTSVTNNPDFQAQIVVQEIGKYTIHMTAQNINGIRSIDDYFTVQQTPPAFDIMRTSYPTRIYPYSHYPVQITVVANQDYSGNVSDLVPANFQISDISAHGVTNSQNDYQQINWQANMVRGNTYTFSYDIKFPLVSPEFYLVGPFVIGKFSEGREWQIASDAIALAQTPVSQVIDSGTSISATYGSTITAGNLEVVVCSETSNATLTAPSRGNGGTRGNSWTTAAHVATTPFIYLYERVGKATDNKTVTCGFSSSTGVKAIQIFEYSGLATATVLDQHSSTSDNGSCSSGSYTTQSITITNPNELIFASVVATTLRTVNSHTAGFTQEFALGGSTAGTFTTADQTSSSITSFSDKVTFSGNAGNCSAVIASFITPIDLSQNGFQFFANAVSTSPGTAVGSQNQNLTLPIPHSPFRLRLLIDLDGTVSLGLKAGDFILQYATLSAGLTCATANYDPVSIPGNGTDIAFNSNGLGSGVNITSSGDPADSGYTTEAESYYEDDFSSAGPSGGGSPGDITNDQLALSNSQAGLWDFSLIDNTTDIQSNTYCLEITNADSSPITTYVRYPKVTTFYNEVNLKSGSVIKSGTIIK